MLGSLLLLLLLGPEGETARPCPELHAREWLNNPPLLIHDDRELILFFFDPDSRECARRVPVLNRLARNPRRIVIGLTAARGPAVEGSRPCLCRNCTRPPCHCPYRNGGN